MGVEIMCTTCLNFLKTSVLTWTSILSCPPASLNQEHDHAIVYEKTSIWRELMSLNDLAKAGLTYPSWSLSWQRNTFLFWK